MPDPMDTARAMQAFMRQGPELMAACRAELAAAGLGFSPDDLAAIAASAAANPDPPPTDPAVIQEAAARAASAVYPPDGFAPGDPRLAPVEGVSLALYALGSKAIGWATDDAITDRVASALGIEPDRWRRASAAWNERVAADIVLASFYGQVFAAADVTR
jgi:hypothetical protein